MVVGTKHLKGWEAEWANPQILNLRTPPWKNSYNFLQELLKIQDFHIFGHMHMDMHVFYFIFVRFRLFPVFDFGLARHGSEPFI